MSKHEVLARDEYRRAGVVIHSHEMLDPEAQLASQLVDRWGMVAGVPDGEDSSGRAKLRLATAEEVVTRAFDAAQATFAEARKRGLTISIKPYADLEAEANEHRKRN